MLLPLNRANVENLNIDVACYFSTSAIQGGGHPQPETQPPLQMGNAQSWETHQMFLLEAVKI